MTGFGARRFWNRTLLLPVGGTCATALPCMGIFLGVRQLSGNFHTVVP